LPILVGLFFIKTWLLRVGVKQQLAAMDYGTSRATYDKTRSQYLETELK
jgi:hypothetical protein